MGTIDFQCYCITQIFIPNVDTYMSDIVANVPVTKFIAAQVGQPQGQCLMDTFMVTSPGNPSPPMICGLNTGEHSNWLRNYLLPTFHHQMYSVMLYMRQLVSHKSFFIVYVDASDLCNELAFALGPSTTEEMSRAGVLTAVTRSWNIKVRLNKTLSF